MDWDTILLLIIFVPIALLGYFLLICILVGIQLLIVRAIQKTKIFPMLRGFKDKLIYHFYWRFKEDEIDNVEPDIEELDIEELDIERIVEEGGIYEEEIDEEEIDPRLIELVREAAQGKTELYHVLGMIYCEKMAIGYEDYNCRLFIDLEKAFYWFSKGAKKGDVDCQTAAGIMLTKGEGTKIDHVKAFEWFSLAARQGNAEAMRRIAFAYALKRGVPYDPQKAVEYFRKAAETGDEHSAFNLAMAYREGALDLQPDPAEARRLMQLASKLGHPEAKNVLKTMPG